MTLNKKFYDDYVWGLKYRPTNLNDLVMPDAIKNRFRKMLDKREIPNLLFSGVAGVGKTSMACVLADTLDSDVMYINGSIETSIDVLRGKISQFVTTVSFKEGKKIVIIDEADRISLNTQEAIKSFNEEYSKNVIFIFITNNLHKIIDPLKSRLQLVEFSYTPQELTEMKKQFAKIVLKVLNNENVDFNKKIVGHIINNNFPDMRKTLNELQKYQDSLNDPSILDKENNSLEGYFEALKGKDFTTLQKFCANISDAQGFFSKMYDNIKKYIDKSDISAMIVLTSEYSYKASFVKDQRILLMSYSCELMNNIKLKGN